MENKLVQAIFHFTDGSQLALAWPPQAGDDPITVAANIRKALETDRILAEVDGDLILIPLANVTHVRVSPAPPKLPQNVIRGCQAID